MQIIMNLINELDFGWLEKLIYPERASRPLQSFNRSSINFLCSIFYPFRHQTLSGNSYRHFPQYTCLRICAKLRLFYTLLAKYNTCTQSIDAEPKQICYMRASFLFTCNQLRIRQLFNPVTECIPFIKIAPHLWKMRIYYSFQFCPLTTAHMV